jgi:hypothetical protein
MATQTNETTGGAAEATKRRSPSRKAKSRKGKKRRRSSVRNLQTSADQVLGQGKRVMNRAYDWAEDARRAVPRLAKDLRLPRSSDFDVLSEANPLLIGAVGLGIGIVLGTLMPHRFSSSSGSVSRRRSAKTPRRGRRE